MDRPDARASQHPAERHPFWGVPESLAEAEEWRKAVHLRYRDIERDIAIGKRGPIRDNNGFLLPAEAYPQWREERLFKKDKVLSRLHWLSDWIRSERERLGLPGKGARKPNVAVDAMHAAARRFGTLECFLAMFRVWLDVDDDEQEEIDMAWSSLMDAFDRLESEEAA